jgi:hypothetical protein
VETKQDNDVIIHLKQALFHLDESLKATILSLREDSSLKNELGLLWEEFLGTFFNRVKTIGKENKVNLLNLISFARLRKYND